MFEKDSTLALSDARFLTAEGEQIVQDYLMHC